MTDPIRGAARARRLERRRWLQLLGCVLLTYATLGTARRGVDALRDLHLLGVTVTGLFVVAGLAVAIRVLRRRPSGSEILVLVLAAAVYLLLLPRLERIEERLHFLQYGLIGVLAHSALEHRWGRHPERVGWRGPTGTAVAAVALVLAIGWLDEGIQHLLPTRFYDLRDVLFNVVAGALAIGFSIALGRARTSGRGARAQTESE